MLAVNNDSGPTSNRSGCMAT